MTLGNQGAALAVLPQDLSTAPERLFKEGGITAQWTHVSIVKGAYIRGNLEEWLHMLYTFVDGLRCRIRGR